VFVVIGCSIGWSNNCELKIADPYMPGIKKRENSVRNASKMRHFPDGISSLFFWIRPDPGMSKSGTVIKDQFQFQIQFFCLSHVSVAHLSKHSRGQR